MANKRVLVPGGAGYVGSRLVPALLDRGYEVTVLDTFWFGNHLKPHARLTCWEHDIRHPWDASGYDAVIHLACVSNDPSFELNPAVAKSINLDGFVTFLECAIHAEVPRFIYASSSSVYGICAEPATENTECRPLTDYSRYKLECEALLRASGLDYFIARPATACGMSPRMRFDTMLNSFVNQAVNRHAIDVYGGYQMRSHIHIDDLVRFYLRSLETPEVNRTFNVSAASMSIMALAREVADIVGGCTINLTVSDDRRSYQVSAARAFEEMNFAPYVPVSSAIRDIIENMSRFDRPLDNPEYFNLKRMKEIYG